MQMKRKMQMKKAIARNIAIVSAIFMIVLSIMLITNYFQVRNATPLQSEVMETLKELNEQQANNPVLQEQIRQLDLLARRAYFVRMDHLMGGVYILLGMAALFVLCLHLYFSGDKSIPDKKIDPADEWLAKTQARKYLVWGAAVIAAVAVLFVVISSPYLKTLQVVETGQTGDLMQVGETGQDGDLAQVGETGWTADATETGMGLDKTGMDSGETGMDSDETKVDLGDDGSLAGMESEVNNNTSPSNELTKGLSGESDGDSVGESVGNSARGSIPTTSAITHNAFRGNNSNGITQAKRVPVQWNLANGTHIAWRQEMPRAGYNSPIINGNRVFFTGADEQARELYCYNLTTGEKLWSLAATNIPGSPSQIPKTTEDTGLAASTAATNGKQVCAIFATGDILCADMDGNRLWAKNLGVPDNHYGYASSLLIFGNLLIVQYDNRNTPKIMALDLATGNIRWSKNRTEKVTWSSPIIASVGNSPQLVLMGNPAITGYNPNNGEQLWRVECLNGEVGASACSANGIVFGASEYAKLVAINGTDGSVLWENNQYLPEVSSPVATKENLYLATSYGVVASFDTQTGELRKEHELDAEFYSSPVIAEGKVYLFSTDGKMHIFSANNDFNLIRSFDTGERTFATPAFTDGKIVVRTEKSIYCVAEN